MNDPKIILLAIIVFSSYTIETIAGFGSIILSVTLGSFLFPIPELLPILTGLNIILGVYIVSRYRKKINPRLLLGQILPAMGLGFAIGYTLFVKAPGDWLKIAFGIFIVLVSARELAIRLIPRLGETRPHAKWWSWLWTGAAGIVHGIYASGGPVLVYALSGLRQNKAEFRATLSSVWLTLNSILTTLYFLRGSYTESKIEILSFFWVLIPLGIFTGEKLHHKIPEETFRILVYTLLLFAGSALLF